MNKFGLRKQISDRLGNEEREQRKGGRRYFQKTEETLGHNEHVRHLSYSDGYTDAYLLQRLSNCAL